MEDLRELLRKAQSGCIVILEDSHSGDFLLKCTVSQGSFDTPFLGCLPLLESDRSGERVEEVVCSPPPSPKKPFEALDPANLLPCPSDALSQACQPSARRDRRETPVLRISYRVAGS